MPRPPTPNSTDITVHNLSSRTLTSDEHSLLTKGLSFAPTPYKTDTTEQHFELMRHYNDFTKSLRSIYSHSTYKPAHNTRPSDTPLPEQVHQDHSFLYRRMKFIPKTNYITPTQQYTGIETLETYIDQTKTELDTTDIYTDHPQTQQTSATSDLQIQQTTTLPSNWQTRT